MKLPLPEIIDEIMFHMRQSNDLVNKPTMSLLDIPTQKELRGINIYTSDNEILLFAQAYDEDIAIGTVFDIIIPRHSIEKFSFQKAVLKYVSVNRSYEISYLPKGYSGICLLNFPNGKPELLNKLAIYGEKKDYTIHDTLILTQKFVLDRILKKLEK